ncbi:MAG TPA: putative PEP-binding protein [Mycobacteriales bacterium]|jgi:phosphotransferase system enzyme I (PtsI)|nr:putative PEP-binding protein [Mycobacteriales bacterium]
MAEPLTGLGVSPGVAVGPVARMGGRPALPAPAPVSDVDAEISRAADALDAVAKDLAERAAGAPADAAAILEAQSLMAGDPTLVDAIGEHVRAGQDAAHAVHAAFGAYRELLAGAGGYLAERVADLDDVRDRAVATVLGEPMPGVPAPGHPYVLVADDLAPADTVGLDPATVLALVTERGSPTSHTAILARSLGLPAVVGLPAAASLVDGAVVRVDGSAGTVEVGVDPAQAGTTAAALPDYAGPGRTADGHPVQLLLNVGSAADLATGGTSSTAALRDLGLGTAEGVGLFRTELLFLDRRDMPSAAEQQREYEALLTAVGGRKVVLRTLDAGADKPLPFLGLRPEPNPALGVRGLRVARVQPEVLTTQLGAVAAAAAATGAEVWVMAPMVSTAAEAASFADAARAAGLPTAGVMIEVPAAALRADRVLAAVDFLSIGTNDLGQYTMAADRQSGDLAELLDPWQPAVLALVAACGAAGGRAGKPVGVCGEAAADPLLALVLTGLGMTSLSMSARAVPLVGAALAAHTLAECEALARLALDADGAAAAREAVRTAA